MGLEPTTSRISSFGASPTAWSGRMRIPLLAMTGSMLGAMITLRNSSRRAAILAMRRVSMAEAKPMVVKFGITKKPTVFTVG